jgi:hypothetical protein
VRQCGSVRGSVWHCAAVRQCAAAWQRGNIAPRIINQQGASRSKQDTVLSLLATTLCIVSQQSAARGGMLVMHYCIINQRGVARGIVCCATYINVCSHRNQRDAELHNTRRAGLAVATSYGYGERAGAKRVGGYLLRRIFICYQCIY